MDIINKVKNCIEENELLGKDDKVVLGLSGGPDSVCLYDILIKLGYDVYPVHINHKLRPGDAELDQDFCIKLCDPESRHPLQVFTYDCNKIAEDYGITSEEAGRKVRYEAYDHVANILAKEYPREKVKIATAHNANDQAETVLFRIMRGTGIDGLSGMPLERKSDEGFSIVRPILGIDRKEIEKYCDRNGLNPCIDKTNLEPVYTRNKIRLELLPLIEKKFNDNIFETLTRLADNARLDSDFLWKESKKSYLDCHLESDEESLDIKKLQLLHPAIRYRVYNLALKEIGMTKDMSKVYLDSVDQIVFSSNGKAWTPIRKEYKVIREHNQLIFKKEK